MRTHRLSAILIVVLTLVLLSLHVLAAPQSDSDKVDVLVGFHSRPAIAQVRQLDVQITREFNIVDAVAARMSPQAAEALARVPGIAYVEPNLPVYALGQTVPWGVDRVFGDEEYPFSTWDTSTGTGVAVAVLDTGIDDTHPDLLVLGGTNTIDDTHWGSDVYGHGTPVAGVIAALDNDIGVVGVAPEVGLYSVKVLNDSGGGTISSIVAGIEWAVEQGIPILNMSFGSGHSQTLRNACDAAYAAGHLLVAAAGNSGNEEGTGENVRYPAAFSSVVAVAASGDDDKRASFSSTGPEVELIAPGVDVLSPVPLRPLVQTLTVAGIPYAARVFEGSGLGSVTGPVVDCGLALTEECVEGALDDAGVEPGDTWIALIDRGEITFAEKVRNVMEHGAAAAIIVNDDQNNPDDRGRFTLYATPEDEDYEWVPAVSVSYNSGAAIREEGLGEGTVGVEEGKYDYFSGTSLSSPHVAGVAALMWSANPELTNIQVRQILRDTAEDLGLGAYHQGYGMVRADLAVDEVLRGLIQDGVYLGGEVLKFYTFVEFGFGALALRTQIASETTQAEVTNVHVVEGGYIASVRDIIDRDGFANAKRPYEPGDLAEEYTDTDGNPVRPPAAVIIDEVTATVTDLFSMYVHDVVGRHVTQGEVMVAVTVGDETEIAEVAAGEWFRCDFTFVEVFRSATLVAEGADGSVQRITVDFE